MIFNCPNCYKEYTARIKVCSCGYTAIGGIQSSNGLLEWKQPGNELAKLIPKMFETEDCNCSAYASKMNRWGVGGCTLKFDNIVHHLVSQAKKMHLPEIIARPTATALLHKAIDNCRPLPEKVTAPKFDKEIVNTHIISAGDEGFLTGLYILCWTLLHRNKCNVTIYNLGFSTSDPRAKQMASWGVKFRRPPKGPMKGVRGWQSWNKPFYLLDALTQRPEVLWLDGDTVVGDSISDVDNILIHSPFIPSHGNYQPKHNDSTKALQQLLGESKRKWSGGNYPCAGICGFTRRDLTFIQEWCRRTELVNQYPVLRKATRFWDQNILQDMVDFDLQDGTIWNNFGIPRQATEQNIVNYIYGEHGRKINHFGGRIKPFHSWSRKINWGVP